MTFSRNPQLAKFHENIEMKVVAANIDDCPPQSPIFSRLNLWHYYYRIFLKFYPTIPEDQGIVNNMRINTFYIRIL